MTDPLADLPPDGHEPHLTVAEVDEACLTLSRLHTLLGPQAPEVMAVLVTLIHRRDGAARVILRWLRSLDEQARRP